MLLLIPLLFHLKIKLYVCGGPEPCVPVWDWGAEVANAAFILNTEVDSLIVSYKLTDICYWLAERRRSACFPSSNQKTCGIDLRWSQTCAPYRRRCSAIFVGEQCWQSLVPRTHASPPTPFSQECVRARVFAPALAFMPQCVCVRVFVLGNDAAPVCVNLSTSRAETKISSVKQVRQPFGGQAQCLPSVRGRASRACPCSYYHFFFFFLLLQLGLRINCFSQSQSEPVTL